MMAESADNHWLHPQDPGWGWRVSTLCVNATKPMLQVRGAAVLPDGAACE